MQSGRIHGLLSLIVVITLLGQVAGNKEGNENPQHNGSHRASRDAADDRSRERRTRKARDIVAVAHAAEVQQRRNVTIQALGGARGVIAYASVGPVAIGGGGALDVGMGAPLALRAAVHFAQIAIVAVDGAREATQCSTIAVVAQALHHLALGNRLAADGCVHASSRGVTGVLCARVAIAAVARDHHTRAILTRAQRAGRAGWAKHRRVRTTRRTARVHGARVAIVAPDVLRIADPVDAAIVETRCGRAAQRHVHTTTSALIATIDGTRIAIIASHIGDDTVAAHTRAADAC